MMAPKLLRTAAVLGLTALVAAPRAATAEITDFTVVKISGSQAKYRIEADFKALEEKKAYPFGTTLKTGRKTTVDLEFSPENAFRLMPRTTLTIVEDVKDARLKVLKLERGRVQAKLDNFPPDHGLQVETPTAVCGALGTHFTVAFEDEADAGEAPAEESSRKNAISCEQGAVYASTSFTVNGTTVQGETMTVPRMEAGTAIVAVVHEGAENSYTDITLQQGQLDLVYGIADGPSFTLKAPEQPAHLVCSLEKSDQPVAIAALRVEGGTVEHKTKPKKGLFRKAEGVVTPISSDDGAVLIRKDEILREDKEKTTLVSQYLVAAQKEGEIHSQVVDKRKLNVVTPEDEAALTAAAERATKLRKQLLSARTRRLLRNIRGAGRRRIRPRR